MDGGVDMGTVPRDLTAVQLFKRYNLPSVTASAEQFSPFSLWHIPEKKAPNMLAPSSVQRQHEPNDAKFRHPDGVFTDAQHMAC